MVGFLSTAFCRSDAIITAFSHSLIYNSNCRYCNMERKTNRITKSKPKSKPKTKPTIPKSKTKPNSYEIHTSNSVLARPFNQRESSDSGKLKGKIMLSSDNKERNFVGSKFSICASIKTVPQKKILYTLALLCWGKSLGLNLRSPLSTFRYAKNGPPISIESASPYNTSNLYKFEF